MHKFIDRVLYWRQVARQIFTSNSTYFIIAFKALAALCIYWGISNVFPYRHFLTRMIVIIALALFTSVLPATFTSVLAGVLLLAQLSAFSLEATAEMLVILLVIAVLSYLLQPRCGMLTALIPLLMLWKIPYAAVLLAGILAGISGFVSVGCGVVIFYTLKTFADNAVYLTDTASSTLVERLLFLVKAFLNNEEMFIVMVVFSVTALVVHFLSRLDVDYSHTIAIGIGAIFCPILMTVSFRFFEVENGLGGRFWGTVLGLAVTLLVDFFLHGLDYRHTERVQFEDDDYYYFVKAVPKIVVPDRAARMTAAFEKEETEALKKSVGSFREEE